MVCFLCMPCRGGSDLGWKGVFEGCVPLFMKTQETWGLHTWCDTRDDSRGDSRGDTRGVTRCDARAHTRGKSVAPCILILNSTSFPPCYLLPGHRKPAPKTVLESLLHNLHEAWSEDDSRLICLPVCSPGCIVASKHSAAADKLPFTGKHRPQHHPGGYVMNWNTVDCPAEK